MPRRSFLIASTRSSRSVVSDACWALDLAQFLFGAEIDRAEPLALAPQALERGFDLGEIRQRVGRLDLGELRHRRRLDLQHVVNFAADIRKPALGALETLLGAGKFLARGAGCFERGARIAVGLGQRVLGLLQAVGAGAPFGLGGLHLGDQGAALFREYLRRIFQLGAIALGLGDALLERRDLGAGALLTFDPAGLCRWRAATAGGRRVRLRARSPVVRPELRQAWRACRRCRRAPARASFRDRRRAQARRARTPPRPLAAVGLVAAHGQPCARLGQRRKPRGLPVEVALARAAFRFRCCLLHRRPLARLPARGAWPRRRRARRQFGVDLGEPAALRKPSRGAGRRMRGGDETVPAPQVAFARYQPLAGLERGGKPGAGIALDHADLREPPRELRRRLDVACQRLDALRQCRVAAVALSPRSSAWATRDRPARRDRRRARRPAPSRSLSRPRHGRSPAATGCGSRAPASWTASLPRSPAAAARFSASPSAARAASSSARATLCAASAATAAASASVSAACAPSTAAASGALSAPCSVDSSRSIAAISAEIRATRSPCSRAAFSNWLRWAARSASAVVTSVKIFSAADKCAVGLGHFGVDAAAAAGAFARLRADGFFLGGEARDRCSASAASRCSRSRIGGELHQPQIELGDAVLGARLFAVEILQRDIEAVQRRAGARLCLAQLGQCGGGQSPAAWRLPPRRRYARQPCAR